jgi:CHAT domain-containing protein
MLGHYGLSLLKKTRLHGLLGMWVLLLLVALPLEDRQTRRAQAEYDHAYQHFLHGELLQSQQEATDAADRYAGNDSAWALKFRRLEVDSLIYRGKVADAERIVAAHIPVLGDAEGTIWRLDHEAYFAWQESDLTKADQKAVQALRLCVNADFPVCSESLQIQGLIAEGRGQGDAAMQYLFKALTFAQRHHDQSREAEIEGTLGVVSADHQRMDEAIDWYCLAYRHQLDLGARFEAGSVEWNLGIVYQSLGDRDRALASFSDAEHLGAGSDSVEYRFDEFAFLGNFYKDDGDPERAIAFLKKAVDFERRNGYTMLLRASLNSLSEAELDIGDVADAAEHLRQVLGPVETRRVIAGPFNSVWVGRLAAARHQDARAKSLLRPVLLDSAANKTARMRAGLELGRLYEREGRGLEAERMYKTGVAIFEAARTAVSHQESALSIAATAKPLYEGYISLLVRRGRVADALAVADSSRAQALAQGLGVAAGPFSFRHAAWNPQQVAKRAGATILFYWLGKQQSYLWAVDGKRIVLKRLPGAAEFTARVDRYRKALEEKQDPLQANSLCREDGRALYDLLAAPAAKRIKPNGRVMILADGALSRLNFETLLAPGPPPGPAKTLSHGSPSAHEDGKRARPLPLARSAKGDAHYWIEDATIASAPSLSMLATAKPDSGPQGKLLLVGDAVSPSPEYPALALAGMEMNLVQRHFTAGRRTVLTRERATPAAYLGSSPAQYAYLHFVTHGTASTVAPLESAIVLSRDGGGGAPYHQGPFKLYARDIVQHPVDARLVTISACYGSGARTYTGEGLVGLAWAFLRAGAHNVIGALWEVSDESTPRLMDGLYNGLDAGLDPAAALRASKLALLHSKSSFHAPFFWAGFQLYTGR